MKCFLKHCRNCGFILVLLLSAPSCGKSNSYKLVEAIINGNSKDIVSVLNQGVDLNILVTIKDKHLQHLMMGLSDKDVEAREKIKKTIGVETMRYYEKMELTPLIAAAGLDNREAAILLIEKGAEVNKVNSEKVSALKIAINHRHWEMVRLLLDKGADIHNDYPDGITTLQVALNGHWEMVKIFKDLNLLLPGRDVSQLPPKLVFLSIEKDLPVEMVKLNNGYFEIDMLENFLRDFYQTRQDRTITIRADESVPGVKVKKLIEIVKKVGLELLDVIVYEGENDEGIPNEITEE